MLHAEYRRFEPGIEVQNKRREANEEIGKNSNRSLKMDTYLRGTYCLEIIQAAVNNWYKETSSWLLLQLQHGEFKWKLFTETPSTQLINLLTKMYFTCSTVAWSAFSLLLILPIAMSCTLSRIEVLIVRDMPTFNLPSHSRSFRSYNSFFQQVKYSATH